MRPLYIVHAIPFFDPATRFGGPIAQLRRLCSCLAERGHDVRVITTDLDVGPDVPRGRWVDRDGYRVWYAPAGRMGCCAPYYAPRTGPPLLEALRGAHVLHLALSFTHMNVVGRRASRRLGVPYVYTPRSCLDPVRLAHRRLSKLAFHVLFERRIIRDAAAVHVLTDAERRQVLRRGARPAQCAVIPNGAELGPGTGFPEGALFRSRFGLPGTAPLVLFLGRLHRLKGLDLLVDGFAAARRQQPAARLVIAGPDEGQRRGLERRAARRGVADAVSFAGRVDGELRLSALRAADLLALTSYSEGLPNAVLEACAAGTPVLVTDRCNVPEVAAAGAGRVVEAQPAAVAAGLAEMLADPAALRRMGAAGPRLVPERFAFSAVTDRIERLYRRLASAPAVGGAAAVKAA